MVLRPRLCLANDSQGSSDWPGAPVRFGTPFVSRGVGTLATALAAVKSRSCRPFSRLYSLNRPRAGRFRVASRSAWLTTAVFSTPTTAWQRPGHQPDPELLYRRDAHLHTRLRFTGADLAPLRGVTNPTIYQCDLRLDCNGFRNPTDLSAADVIVLGDSFIEGLHVSEPELMSAQLERTLGRSVANLGRTGYGPQQELAVLRRYGLKLSPRTCVWAFYEGNDLQDVLSYQAEAARARRATAHPPTWSRQLYARGFIRNALAMSLRPAPAQPLRLYTGRLVDRLARTTDVYFSCGVNEGKEPRPYGDMSVGFELLRSVLTAAQTDCAQHGIDLIVVFVPAKFRVYANLCTFDRDSPCRNWKLDDLPARIQELLVSVPGEIGYLDLTPRFRAEADAGTLPYLVDDTHWSARGHRAAAEAIASILSTRRITNTGGPDQSRQRTTRVPPLGRRRCPWTGQSSSQSEARTPVQGVD